MRSHAQSQPRNHWAFPICINRRLGFETKLCNEYSGLGRLYRNLQRIRYAWRLTHTQYRSHTVHIREARSALKCRT